LLERRSIHVAELERRAELGLARIEERERKVAEETATVEQLATELAQREEELERRKRELDMYVSRVQGSLPSQA
jgi:hypothetical protein